MNRARLLGPMIGSFALASDVPASSRTPPPGAAGAGNATGLGGFGGSSPPPMPCQGMCTDFPSTPRHRRQRAGERGGHLRHPRIRRGRRTVRDRAAGQHAVPQQLAASALPVQRRRGPLRDPLHASNQAQRSGRLHENTTWTMEKRSGRRWRSTRATSRSRSPCAARRPAAAGAARQPGPLHHRARRPRTASSSTGRRRGRRTSTASRPAPRPC